MLSIPASCISSRANRKTTYFPIAPTHRPILKCRIGDGKIWQVSQSGKPHCTASSKTPIGILSFAKLARWALPPWNPQQRFIQPLHTGADYRTSEKEIIPRIISFSTFDSLEALPLHSAKGIRFPLETSEYI
ncbi:hypothetical protein SAMN02910263_03273 [Butyrivibrio sp. INlla16]|nr:hypothetical protein SAMN02910263_03273 [Butyrivibrio sp. INlla16]